MNAVYCTAKDRECTQPTRCQQFCQYRRNVQEQHGLIQPRPNTFRPDYGVTRARYTYRPTNAAVWLFAVASGLAFWVAVGYVASRFF